MAAPRRENDPQGGKKQYKIAEYGRNEAVPELGQILAFHALFSQWRFERKEIGDYIGRR